ncbi:MAG: hypothetical protein ACOY3I_04195 [Verrucomicrobiota bacterium]
MNLFWGLSIIFLFLLCMSMGFAETHPQTLPVSEVVIKEVVPRRIHLGAGGAQLSAAIKGTNLDKIKAIRIYREGKLTQEILGRMGSASEMSRIVYFVAAPIAVQENGYKISVLTKDKFELALPLEVEVVPPTDKRAQPVSTGEMAKGQGDFASSTLSVEASESPVVTKTIPAPFAIPANGAPQDVTLKGKYLDKITEIRLRPEGKKSYIGDSGKLSFEKKGKDLTLQLMATPETPPGTKYCLDLIMGRFIAGTLTFEILAIPATTSVIKSSDENSESIPSED